MAKTTSFALIVTFCCLSHAVLAGDSGESKQFSICMDKSGGVTVEMRNCIGTEIRLQEARLNKAYKDVMAQLSPDRKKQLQDAQRLWIKYREANCSFYADPDGGSMATVDSGDCYMSATTARANELERFKN